MAETGTRPTHDCNDHMVEYDDGYGWDCSVCWDRHKLSLEYMKACVRVAANARLFAQTTDDVPLMGMSFDQGVVWDWLTDSLAVLDELEDEGSPGA